MAQTPTDHLAFFMTSERTAELFIPGAAALLKPSGPFISHRLSPPGRRFYGCQSSCRSSLASRRKPRRIIRQTNNPSQSRSARHGPECIILAGFHSFFPQNLSGLFQLGKSAALTNTSSLQLSVYVPCIFSRVLCLFFFQPTSFAESAKIKIDVLPVSQTCVSQDPFTSIIKPRQLLHAR